MTNLWKIKTLNRENTLIIVRIIKQRIKELNAQLIGLNDKIKERDKKDEKLKELSQKKEEITPMLKDIKNKVKVYQNKVINFDREQITVVQGKGIKSVGTLSIVGLPDEYK